MILCSDPKAQYLALKDEIDEVIAETLASGRYILGEQVAAFEDEFAAYVGLAQAIGVANGTDALHLALKACGVGPGDEVLTVSHTAVATVAAIQLCGATPVFVDIDARTYTMDAGSLKQKITENTKAVLPVHLYGHPADMTEICRFARAMGIYVIEDCAQAHGAALGGKKVGTFGDLACFSFYPTKNLGALGDAGAVAGSNAALCEKVRLLREYGWQERFHSKLPGWNSRLDEVQAAVLRVKLKHLDEFNRARQALAGRYEEALNHPALHLPQTADNCEHVFHLYVLRCRQRDALQRFLNDRGIAAAIHYPLPVHRQEAYRTPGLELAVTEKVCHEILSLPMYPELGDGVEAVIAQVKEFFTGEALR